MWHLGLGVESAPQETANGSNPSAQKDFIKHRWLIRQWWAWKNCEPSCKEETEACENKVQPAFGCRRFQGTQTSHHYSSFFILPKLEILILLQRIHARPIICVLQEIYISDIPNLGETQWIQSYSYHIEKDQIWCLGSRFNHLQLMGIV